ncbi:LuxR C-terminal-related transcriptional regulator [Kitasatospora sp. NPDC097605]|uniref:helix-turn-helix transcriptional regulator n=1 Tax=Kitasatospora sp. NPDC097605 TaxID=3157226 RepID=UPI0033167E2C
MPDSLPDKPNLTEAEVLLLRQVAGGHLNAAVSRATGIAEARVGDAVTALTFKLGTPHRHHAAALGAAWGWVRTEDVPVLNPSGLPLPRRHREVLAALVGGEDPKATAKRLHLTEGTVKTYLQDILRTLGVRSRPQAAARALLTGLVPLNALGDGWPNTRLGGPNDRTARPAGTT